MVVLNIRGLAFIKITSINFEDNKVAEDEK